MSGRLLEVDGLRAGYGGREVLSGVNFSLRAGTVTGLLGANGSGKSTLIKAVGGFLPHRGECILGGEALERMTVRQRARRISYIPQRAGMSLSIPVLDAVLLGYNPVLGILEHPSAAQIQSARTALSAVGLGEMADRDFQTLSEGQKQMVFLARTAIEGAPLLLMDEPDSALDPANRLEALARIRQMVRGKARAALVSLHDPQLALSSCDELLILSGGVIGGRIRPATDASSDMETALEPLCGRVSVRRVEDADGGEHLVVLPRACSGR